MLHKGSPYGRMVCVLVMEEGSKPTEGGKIFKISLPYYNGTGFDWIFHEGLNEGLEPFGRAQGSQDNNVSLSILADNGKPRQLPNYYGQNGSSEWLRPSFQPHDDNYKI
ncbi:hypothetical protein BpHYR1_016747 [Brachionus plicatilis]|uniref:Uncharacterized protein n=1 Tax=Brachionus plicatilis TaxID=10195 RepID=A0A3M7Q2L6_BRAPC|nr:hypothetical protein BpHYR1_016747 [Brachionus plicatilis]